MSGISGLSENFGYEFMAAAMTKRSTEEQGKMAIDMLQSTVQNVQQVKAAAPTNSRVGSNVNTMA